MTDIYSQSRSQQMTAPPLPVQVWGATDRGRRRDANEDAVYPRSDSDTSPVKVSKDQLAQKGHLLIVADGVGGGRGGREASHWAIRVAAERYKDSPDPNPGTALRSAVEAANASLFQYLRSTGAQGAGSTMVGAVLHGNTLHVANVGDSRAYLIRDGQISQLTRDHTLTQQKLDQGLIRPEQAEMDPDGNVLVRSMGARESVQADLFPPLQLMAGDTVLLCSDGLTDMLSNTEIARLATKGSPKKAVKTLIAAANRQGGFDNISVVIAQAGGKKAASKERGLLSEAGNLSGREKTVLKIMGGVALLVMLFFCGLMGWNISGWGRETPTPTPTMITPPTATETPTISEAITDTVTLTQTGTVTQTLQKATSTPAPLLTTTPTPTSTPTLTPTSTPTPTPTSTPIPPPPVPPTNTPSPEEPEPEKELPPVTGP